MSTAPQRDDAWLKTATPEEIADAMGRGELAELLGRAAPSAEVDGQAAEVDLEAMTPEQVADAYHAGKFDALLGRAGVRAPA